VQKLREELKLKEQTILGLEEKLGSLVEELKKEQVQRDELQKQIQAEEMKRKDEEIKRLREELVN